MKTERKPFQAIKSNPHLVSSDAFLSDSADHSDLAGLTAFAWRSIESPRTLQKSMLRLEQEGNGQFGILKVQWTSKFMGSSEF